MNENPTVLVPGMITSDEPGLYKTGEYGIRIENLVLSRNYRHTDDFGDFMNFEVLTLFPYDSRLIDLSMLSADEPGVGQQLSRHSARATHAAS